MPTGRKSYRKEIAAGIFKAVDNVVAANAAIPPHVNLILGRELSTDDLNLVVAATAGVIGDPLSVFKATNQAATRLGVSRDQVCVAVNFIKTMVETQPVGIGGHPPDRFD